jgi:hypothetical protein
MNIGLFTILKNLKIIGKQSDVVSDRRVKAFDRVYFFKQGQQRKNAITTRVSQKNESISFRW